MESGVYLYFKGRDIIHVFRLTEVSSRVGTSYNVREKWKKCRHEFLEMRKWDPGHKGKDFPQEQEVYLLKQKESKALGTDTSRLINR